MRRHPLACPRPFRCAFQDDDDDDDEVDPEIDPSAIISSGRRTRGVKVDYTSAEALKKAGLKPEGEDDDDEEEEMKPRDD